MPELTLDNVQPLVSNLNVSGRRVTVQFRCPASQHTVQAQYTAAPKSSNRMAKTAQRTVMYEVRRAITPVLRGEFGRSMFGRPATRSRIHI